MLASYLSILWGLSRAAGGGETAYGPAGASTQLNVTACLTTTTITITANHNHWLRNGTGYIPYSPGNRNIGQNAEPLGLRLGQYLCTALEFGTARL